jgi:hypothetical protein
MRNDHQVLGQLLDRCERGAAELERDAEDPNGRLCVDRGWSSMTPQMVADWGRRHGRAAAALRVYVAELRRKMKDEPTWAVPADTLALTDVIACAATCGGTYMDSETLRDHYPRTRELIIGSGLFQHVAEPGQLAYFALNGNTEESAD